MSEYLSCAEFQWVSPEKIDEEFISRLEDDADYCYLFEVEKDYPAHLHELHNKYPVAPEKVEVTENMLSPYAKNVMKEKKIRAQRN